MDIRAEVMSKYRWLDAVDVERIVDRAKMFYYSLAYPADMSVDEDTHPLKGFRVKQWLLTACDEIVERLGFNSAIGYKENGIVWTFDNCHLSNFLVKQISPVVGVINNEKL